MKSNYLKDAISINDVTIVPLNKSNYEHPFEYMAYEIQNKIINL